MSQITHVSQLISELEPLRESLLGRSYLLLSLCLAISVAFHQYLLVEGNGHIRATLFKLFMYFSILGVYNSLFINSEKIILGIASEIFSGQSFKDFFQTISTGLASSTNKDSLNVWGVLQSGLSGAIITLSYIIAILSYKILTILKVLILGLLYVLGPFVLALSLLPNAGNLAIAWVKNIISISCWPIVINLLLLLQKIIGLASFHSNPEDFIPLLAANLTFTMALLSTPTIVSMLIDGLSSAASSSGMANTMYKATMIPAMAGSLVVAGKQMVSNKAKDMINFKNLSRKGIDVKK